MKRLRPASLAAISAAIGLALCGYSHAQTKPLAATQDAPVKTAPSATGAGVSIDAANTARLLFPNAPIKQVPGGLLEVDAKVYVTTDGRMILVGGRAIDPGALAANGRAAPSVVAAQPAAVASPTLAPVPPAPVPVVKVDYKSLPKDKSITVVKGDGSRRFSVFTDVDCPYCKMLETTLKDMTNYTMHVYLLPIAQLHPGSRAKSESIWCAGGEKDRELAWGNWWTTGRLPQGAACESPIKDIQEIAARLNIRGTPTLIREDGYLIPGAMPKQQLESWLSGS